jgi:hypothetical protein
VDNNQSIYTRETILTATAMAHSTAPSRRHIGIRAVGTCLEQSVVGITSKLRRLQCGHGLSYRCLACGKSSRSDQVDDLVLSQVKTLGNGTTGTGAGTTGPDGSLYTSSNQTGLGNNGYGTINGGIAPMIPMVMHARLLEKAVGLNIAANDAMTIVATATRTSSATSTGSLNRT